jgi:hypothetical protein
VPGTGDVLVAVHAASFTPDELTWPSTWVVPAMTAGPSSRANEVSGVVAELGWGAAGVAPGDEAFGLLSHVEAATLPLAGLTSARRKRFRCVPCTGTLIEKLAPRLGDSTRPSSAAVRR